MIRKAFTFVLVALGSYYAIETAHSAMDFYIRVKSEMGGYEENSGDPPPFALEEPHLAPGMGI